jgi:hypothetical protein
MNSNEWRLTIDNSSHKKDHPMLQKIINWLKRVWCDDVEREAEYMIWDDYEYLRNKYGIREPFAHEEEENRK